MEVERRRQSSASNRQIIVPLSPIYIFPVYTSSHCAYTVSSELSIPNSSERLLPIAKCSKQLYDLGHGSKVREKPLESQRKTFDPSQHLLKLCPYSPNGPHSRPKYDPHSGIGIPRACLVIQHHSVFS
jgi:hypothetical protein